MNLLLPAALTAVIMLALLHLLWTVFKTQRSTLNTVWALFCASLALVMLDRALGESLGASRMLLLLPASATCGMFWLVARALFRPEPAVCWQHGLLVAAILLPAAPLQLLPDPPPLLSSALSSLVMLFGSTAMVLSAWEGVHGWNARLPVAERRMRLIYCACIGSCVLISQSFSPAADAAPALLRMELLLHALCAIAVLLVAGGAVSYRRRHPLEQPQQSSSNGSARPEPSDEDRALAARIEQLMGEQALFLRPELKVGSLAELLGVPEYRVSLAIGRALGQDNFNRYVNHYRIAHAQAQLANAPDRSILAIGIDSDFGSIGPFNRAFKTVAGLTPREYRSQLKGDGLT